jgi:hypothetical protein
MTWLAGEPLGSLCFPLGAAAVDEHPESLDELPQVGESDAVSL